MDKERLFKICKTVRSSCKYLNIYALQFKVIFPNRCTELGANNEWTATEFTAKKITRSN